MRRLAWRAVIVGALVGCGPTLAVAPSALRPEDEGFSEADPLVPPGLADDPETPFTLIAGDTLVLHVVSSEVSEAGGLFVDDRGMLAVPLVGAVDVRGLTLPEASQRIEASLHDYDSFARVWLTVSEPAGHKASVLGAVEHPGTVVVRGGMRVADAVAAVGGPKVHDVDGQLFDVADLDGARIVRDAKTVPISMTRALEGDPHHNVRVRPLDLVYLPPARHRGVSILGDVKAPRVVPYARGLRLSMALALAGGATREADESDVRIVRGRPSAPRIYRASLRALVRGESGDVLLAPGDIVYVSEHWFATAADVMQKTTPLLLGVTVAAALAR